MPNGLGHTASLTRIGLTLTPPPRRVRRFFAAVALVAIAFAAGFGVHELLRQAPAAVVAPAAAAPHPELAQLRQQLEQAQLGLRVAEARGQELERQVDSLNQKLTESQDELTFFRKAREGRKH
jgi:septal ring factor EnvC (AmiA/AmiB activator)